jgi:hypothetical protein
MMKQFFKRVLRRFAQPILSEVRATAERIEGEAATQKTLMQQYRLLASICDKRLPNFRDVGFRKYSECVQYG